MWQNAKADYGVRARPGAASCPHEDQAQQMVSDLQAQTCMVLSCAQGIALSRTQRSELKAQPSSWLCVLSSAVVALSRLQLKIAVRINHEQYWLSSIFAAAGHRLAWADARHLLSLALLGLVSCCYWGPSALKAVVAGLAHRSMVGSCVP